MLRRFFYITLILLGFISLLFASSLASDYVYSDSSAREPLNFLRFFFEGIFVLAPLFFYVKIKKEHDKMREEAEISKERNKAFFVTSVLLVVVLLVELFLVSI